MAVSAVAAGEVAAAEQLPRIGCSALWCDGRSCRWCPSQWVVAASSTGGGAREYYVHSGLGKVLCVDCCCLGTESGLQRISVLPSGHVIMEQVSVCGGYLRVVGEAAGPPETRNGIYKAWDSSRSWRQRASSVILPLSAMHMEEAHGVIGSICFACCDPRDRGLQDFAVEWRDASRQPSTKLPDNLEIAREEDVQPITDVPATSGEGDVNVPNVPHTVVDLLVFGQPNIPAPDSIPQCWDTVCCCCVCLYSGHSRFVSPREAAAETQALQQHLR